MCATCPKFRNANSKSASWSPHSITSSFCRNRCLDKGQNQTFRWRQCLLRFKTFRGSNGPTPALVASVAVALRQIPTVLSALTITSRPSTPRLGSTTKQAPCSRHLLRTRCGRGVELRSAMAAPQAIQWSSTTRWQTVGFLPIWLFLPGEPLDRFMSASQYRRPAIL